MLEIGSVDSLLKFCNENYSAIQKKQIIFVVNVQEINGEADLEFNKANNIECFTAKEYQEILSSINELEINYKIYFNELDFISAVLNHEIVPKDILVFNFARNGLKEGKKSLIPSFCSLLNIKCTGSNAFVQSLCRNKFVYNKYLKELGVKVPSTFGVSPNFEWLGNLSSTNLSKIIIKPIAESGSIGVENNILDIKDFDKKKLKFVNNQPMLVQEYISGIEIECPFFVFKGKVIDLPPVELIIKKQGFLSTEVSVNNEYNFALFKSNIKGSFKPILDKIVSALNIKDYGRLDFRINNKGEIFLFDIATMPFICEHSSFTFAMESLNFKRSDIFKIILCLAEFNEQI